MAPKPERTHLLGTARALRALGSAVRLDIVERLKLGGDASVRELAARLQRAPSSLYHHVAILSAAGLIVKQGERRNGRRQGVVYSLVADRLQVAGVSKRPSSRAALARIGPALLRHAARAYVRAVAEPGTEIEGPTRAAVLRLLTLRLDAKTLRALNEDIDALVSRWSSQESEPSEQGFRLALVLAPTDPGKGRRSRARAWPGGRRGRALASRKT